MTASFPLSSAPPFPRFRARSRVAAGTRDSVETMARLSSEVPRTPWDRFIGRKFVWRRGEHVALIGPTGQGKTTLLLNILQVKPFVVIFATKPRDESLDRLIQAGYVKMDTWQRRDPYDTPRRILWPDSRRLDEAPKIQQAVFQHAFRTIFREGGWTIALDETFWIVQRLKLGDEVRDILTQGRSMGISLVAATQRPRWVPLEIYDQSTHLFFWRNTDEESLKRLAGLNVSNGHLLRYAIANLETHQVVYVNTRTGQMVRTRAPAPIGG